MKSIRRKRRVPHPTKRHDTKLKWSRSSKGRFWTYRYNAAKANREWEIDLNDFKTIIYSPCVYCGKYASIEEPNGLDRVDNSRGYVPDNIVTSCAVCNLWKSNFTVTEFLMHVNAIYEHQAANKTCNNEK